MVMVLIRLVVGDMVSCLVMVGGGVCGGAVASHSMWCSLDEGLVGVGPGRSFADN